MKRWMFGAFTVALFAALSGAPAATASPPRDAFRLTVLDESSTPPPVDDDTTHTSAPGSGGEPLVAVVDLSSSMEEDDGTGTVKLAGAQRALTDLLRRQPPGSDIGLWTYPDDGNCGAGEFVVPVQSQADPTDLSATIQSLVANGSTPTGDALRAAVDALKSSGFDVATILLVSDGESNCGAPPCDVAKQIVAEGFAITVQAMGFQTSESGRAELQCIADATGGEYHDANDTAELEELLTSVGIGSLEVTLDYTDTVVSGSAATVHVAVRNVGAREIPTAQVSLAPVFGPDGEGLLAVLPPRYLLGNIPGGATVEREWTLSTDTAGKARSAQFRVTAWSPAVGGTTVAGTIEIRTGSVHIGDAGQILQDINASGRPIVIMGDSYSSGEGAGDYQSGTDADYTDTPGNNCHRSNDTYTMALFGTKPTIIACSGAVMNFFDSPNSDNPGVPAQLDVLLKGKPPGLVLLTISGNDIGFSDIIKRCGVGPADCTTGAEGVIPMEGCALLDPPWSVLCFADRGSFPRSVFARIQAQRERLVDLYLLINSKVNSRAWIAARGGERAPIVVLPYPQDMPEYVRAACAGFDSNEVKFGNDVVQALDRVIEDSVKSVSAPGAPIYFADDVVDSVLPDHTACSSDHQINPLDPGYALIHCNGIIGKKAPDCVEIFHPDENGYLSITNRLVQWSQRVDPPDDDPGDGLGVGQGGAVLPGSVSVLALGTDPLTPTSPPAERDSPSARIGATVTMSAPPGAPAAIRAGERTRLTASDLPPYTDVRIELYPEGIALANPETDADGNLDVVVSLPTDLPPGARLITAEYLDGTFTAQALLAPVTVRPPLPWAAMPLLGSVPGLLIAALVLFLLGRRRGRLGAALAAPSLTSEGDRDD